MMDRRKAEDTPTHCEVGMRGRPANLFILRFLVSVSLSRTSVFLASHFTQTLFTLFAQHMHTAFWTKLAHA